MTSSKYLTRALVLEETEALGPNGKFEDSRVADKELDNYTQLYGKYLAYRWGNRHFFAGLRTKLVSQNIETVKDETWALAPNGRF